MHWPSCDYTPITNKQELTGSCLSKLLSLMFPLTCLLSAKVYSAIVHEEQQCLSAVMPLQGNSFVSPCANTSFTYLDICDAALNATAASPAASPAAAPTAPVSPQSVATPAAIPAMPAATPATTAAALPAISTGDSPPASVATDR